MEMKIFGVVGVGMLVFAGLFLFFDNDELVFIEEKDINSDFSSSDEVIMEKVGEYCIGDFRVSFYDEVCPGGVM